MGLWWSDSGGVVMSGPTAWAGNPHAFACRLNDFDGLRESIMFRAPPPPIPRRPIGANPINPPRPWWGWPVGALPVGAEALFRGNVVKLSDFRIV